MTNHPNLTEIPAVIEARPETAQAEHTPAPLAQLFNSLSMTGQQFAIVQRRVSPAELPANAGTLTVQPLEAALARASSPHIRNGKIARLPKLERDMVNRMLFNNIPYAKI